jgi:mRNA interferase RelE/StbE
MYSVSLTDAARQFYERAEAGLQRRLDRCFASLATNPRTHPNIKPLKGSFAGRWRYRIGDYRVIYRIEENRRVVIVLLIEHRKDVYE